LFMRHSATRLIWTHYSSVIAATEWLEAQCANNARRGQVWQSDNGREMRSPRARPADGAAALLMTVRRRCGSPASE
jgi:hypothetical protein